MRILSMIIAAVLVVYFMRQTDPDDLADPDDADGSEDMTEAGLPAGSDDAATDGDAADAATDTVTNDGVQAGDGANGADDMAA